jgi:hypothetical protein
MARKRQHRQNILSELRALKSVPCMDCKKTYPYYVMDYDHRDGTIKSGNVALLAFRGGRNVMLREIEKCDLVCANCHRERTHQRRENKKRMVQ